MNTASLKTFITIARVNSFTKAAQELLVVQSTISSRIKELETEIGQKLFTRSNNNVILTPAGEMFLPRAMKIVEMEESAISEINMSVRYADNLTVACSHTLFDCYIQNNSIDFLQNNSNISLKIVIAHSSEIITNLGAGNLDVAYAYYPVHHARYICKPYVKERLVLVTNSRNRKYLQGITKDELSEVPIISSDITVGNRIEWLPLQRIYPLDVNIIAKIIPFLKSGDWYCFLPIEIVRKEIEEGALIEIPLKGVPPLEKQSYIIYRRDYKKSTTILNWLEPGSQDRS